jgi:DNA-binding NtrC family response regulator
VSRELKILILEDVPLDAVLLERELRSAGIVFTSLRVETRDAFVKQLDDFSPDLILSDYMMPQFTGMEALNIVKERSPATPVIIVTGSMNEETAVQCMKSGASDYVIKEHLARVGMAVKAVLENKRVRDEKAQVEKALAASAREWETTFDAINDAV